MIDIDAAALDALADDLGRIPDEVMDAAEKVVSRGSLNIKRDAADLVDAQSQSRLPHYPRAITYDIDRRSDRVESEIGPDKDRAQGPLGNILEYGTSDTPPIPHLNPALDLEEPRFERAVEALGMRLAAR